MHTVIAAKGIALLEEIRTSETISVGTLDKLKLLVSTLEDIAEAQDRDYFQKKLWRGLGIPAPYPPSVAPTPNMERASLYLSTTGYDEPLTIDEQNQLREELGLPGRFEEVTDADVDTFLNSSNEPSPLEDNEMTQLNAPTM